MATAAILDARVRTGLDEQLQGFQSFEPRRVKTRRFAIGAAPEVKARPGLEEVLTHHTVIAPHRRPKRIAWVCAVVQKKPDHRWIFPTRDSIPKCRRTEISFVFVRRNFSRQVRTRF